MIRTVLCLLALLVWSARAGAEGEEGQPIDLRLGGELTLSPSLLDEQPRVWDRGGTGIQLNYGAVEGIAELSLVNDQKYTPYESYWLGRYWYLDNGGIGLDFGPLKLRGGRLTHRDIVDTPYSLFINSKDLPVMTADLTFEGGPFVYTSRWIRLTTRSQAGYPDRGANYKVFAVNVGELRLGMQDAAVYVDRLFDEEYFLSPLPHIFTQMFTKGTGKPWSESGNDNSIMGLFVEWRRPEHYLYAQWLVDDISLDFLIDLLGLRDEFGNRQIPSKLAWSLGGYYDFPWGRVGLYHAGATKYTFEPTNASYPYGYTYQPAVTYQLEDGTPMPLYPWDNTVGYLYGENNLAFRVEYGHTLGPWVLGGALEYVVSGSKSPGNPWHEYTTYIEAGRKTLLLDDPVLEHVLSVDADVSWTWKWLTLKSRVRLGSVWNQLALESATDGGAAIFRPQPGVNSFLYSWTIGAELKWAGG